MNILSHFHRPSPLKLFFGSWALLVGSAALLTHHALEVRAMQLHGIPTALEIPVIEKRLTVLREQADIAEFQASVGGGQQQEFLRAYVLPQSDSLERPLAAFDVLMEMWRNDGLLVSASPITVGKESDSFVPLHLEVTMTEEGAEQMLLLLDVAGTLTVADAFTPAEVELLLSLTEQENPAALPALESFLGTDVLYYAQDPDLQKDRLLKSFSSQVFMQSLETLLQGSRLQEITALLGSDMGTTLKNEKLWPLRLLLPRQIRMETLGEGQYRMVIDVDAAVRGA